MTIKYTAGGTIIGVSTDTKPSNISANSIFIETDTGNIFNNNGSSWILVNPSQVGTGFGSTYKYTIYKDGSNYKALNNDTGVIDSTNTNARVVIQYATNAVNTAGGGQIFFRAHTTYTNTDGAILEPKDYVCWVGEERDTTIILNPTIKRDLANGVHTQSFGIMSMTLSDNRGGTGVKVLVNIFGTKDCYFVNNRFVRTVAPTVIDDAFILHFGNWDRNQQNIKFVNNIVEGPTFGQDMVGGGSFFNCDFSHNILRKYAGVGTSENNGQGIAFHESIGSHYDHNVFYNLGGNAIGGEGGGIQPGTTPPTVSPVEANTFNSNTIVSCKGGIKLASEDLERDETRNNQVCNNVFLYGQDADGGIRAGHSINDNICNNIFYRTKYRGIWGCFKNCIIANNQFMDTNYSGSYMTGSVPAFARAGGIEMYNNPYYPNDEGDNVIHDNLFIKTGVSFIIPQYYNTDHTGLATDYIDAGTTKTGETGGIGIQNGYVNNKIYNNVLETLETTTRLNDLGTGSKTWNNIGIGYKDNAGLGKLPSARIQGTYIATGITTADGILNILTAAASETTAGQYDTTYGRNRRRTTAASAGSNAGWRTNVTFTQRSFNPRLRARFKLASSATGQRLFIGFRGDISTDASNDNDPLNLEAGFMLGLRSSDTVFQQVSNDSTGGSYFTNITGSPAVDTNVHTIEIFGETDYPRWGYRFDGGAPVYESNTNNMPGATDQLGIMFMIQSQDGAAKSLDQYWAEVETN